jgi:hypothetical protein
MEKFMEKSNDELSLKILTVIEFKMIILSAFQNDELQDIIKKLFCQLLFAGIQCLSLREKHKS